MSDDTLAEFVDSSGATWTVSRSDDIGYGPEVAIDSESEASFIPAADLDRLIAALQAARSKFVGPGDQG